MAVEYFICFMLMLDFTLPTPGIFASDLADRDCQKSSHRRCPLR
jgi:hypothetical protein